MADQPDTGGSSRTSSSAKGLGRNRSMAPGTENILEEAERSPTIPGDPADLSQATTSRPGSSSGRRSVPPQVRDRFLNRGQEYFFPDGVLAFADRGGRLTTRSENSEVVRALVDIAVARGWQIASVAGSRRFRQAAWEAGQSAGLAVRGYVATEVEQLRAQRPRHRTADSVGEPGRAATTASAESTPSPREPSQARSRTVMRISGELIDHGPAPYQFREKEKPSYFVRLRTTEGNERVIWGKDLQRALAEATPEMTVPGAQIALTPVAREQVTVSSRETDADGRLLPTRELRAHRNRWQVDQVGEESARSRAARLFRENRTVAPADLRSQPELTEAFRQVRAAEQFSAARIRDADQRARFVDLVREALARRLANGEPLVGSLQSGGSRTTSARSPDPLELSR